MHLVDIREDRTIAQVVLTVRPSLESRTEAVMALVELLSTHPVGPDRAHRLVLTLEAEESQLDRR